MRLTLLQFFASKFLVLALHLEAGSFPRPLSPQEEIRAFADLRAGDSSAREKLIRHNLRLVAHIAKGPCAVLLSRFQCFLQGNDHTISALPAKMHPQLICYPLPSALWDGKENPPLSRNDASTSKWIFWSRESGSFFSASEGVM